MCPDSARIAGDLRALDQLGWFEDVLVTAEESDCESKTAACSPLHFKLEFHFREYSFLTGVEYIGSDILSEQRIKKMLEDKRLSPQVGAPANPVKLHHIAVTIQSELAATGHPEARVLITHQKLSGQRVKIEFQIHDGPHLTVVCVTFSGHPEISDKVLRNHLSPKITVRQDLSCTCETLSPY